MQTPCIGSHIIIKIGAWNIYSDETGVVLRVDTNGHCLIGLDNGELAIGEVWIRNECVEINKPYYRELKLNEIFQINYYEG